MRSRRGRTLPSRGLSGSINLWALPVVFPRAGTRELFGDARWLFASSTRPSGKAVALRTGFNVSGRWSLVSGCELADWIAVMCVVFDGIEPRMPAKSVPERMVYLPKGFIASGIRGMWGGCAEPEATTLWSMMSSFLRSGHFRSPRALKTIALYPECPSSPACVQVAPHFAWELHRPRSIPC